MARNPNYQLSYTLRDRSRENASFSLNTDGAVDISGILPAAVVEFELALADITQGVITSRRSTTSRKANNADIGAGQRENRVLVTYEDTVTLAVYSTEIGTADPSLETVEGSNLYNLAIAPWLNFVTRFEALARSFDGNPVNVLSISVV